MAYFRTCLGCKNNTDCPTKEALKASIKGLGLTSIKHRCKERVDMFANGEPVIVRTYSGYSEPSDSDYGNDSIFDDYPGHFMKQNGSKALVIVKPGTHGLDHGEDFPFLPKNASGYLSIPLSRIRTNPNGQSACMDVCRRCCSIAAIEGRKACCDENLPWNSDCLFKQQAQTSSEEPGTGDTTSPLVQTEA